MEGPKSTISEKIQKVENVAKGKQHLLRTRRLFVRTHHVLTKYYKIKCRAVRVPIQNLCARRITNISFFYLTAVSRRCT